MKSARIRIAPEALEDLLQLSGVGVRIANIAMNEQDVIEMTVTGDGLPSECIADNSSSPRDVSLVYTKEVLPGDANIPRSSTTLSLKLAQST